MYTATIKVFGKTYTSKGESVREALENLKPETNPKGTVVLTIKHGDAEKMRVLNVTQTSRLFSPSRITRELSLKGIASLFSL